MVFAFVGGAGAAILFVIFLAIWAACLGWTITLASHCYLVVVQGTSSGLDEVKWPDDHPFDWLREAVSLVGLAAIWLAPAGILWKAMEQKWLPDQPVLRFLYLGGPVFWFFFPLSVLSSLGSLSRWQILSGRVLGGLLKLTPSLLIFYPVTALLFAAVGALGSYGLASGGGWYALPVAAILGTAVLLIHARLVGRLGWQLQQLRLPRDKPAKAKGKKKRRPRAESSDPWAEREAQQEAPAATGYQVVEVSEPKAPRPHYMDPEPEPYALPEGEEFAPVKPKVEINEEMVLRELELRTRTLPNPPPASPMFSGVWTFPLYEQTLKAWVWLAACTAATGGAFKMLQTFFPG